MVYSWMVYIPHTWCIMKRLLTLTILLLCVTAILAAGCTTTPASKGDTLFSQAEKEFQNNNLYAADQLFKLAQENYTAAGTTAAALKARDRAMTARMMTREFASNRSGSEDCRGPPLCLGHREGRLAGRDYDRNPPERRGGVVSR